MLNFITLMWLILEFLNQFMSVMWLNFYEWIQSLFVLFFVLFVEQILASFFHKKLSTFYLLISFFIGDFWSQFDVKFDPLCN